MSLKFDDEMCCLLDNKPWFHNLITMVTNWMHKREEEDTKKKESLLQEIHHKNVIRQANLKMKSQQRKISQLEVAVLRHKEKVPEIKILHKCHTCQQTIMSKKQLIKIRARKLTRKRRLDRIDKNENCTLFQT
jgi:hypothetical protein